MMNRPFDLRSKLNYFLRLCLIHLIALDEFQAVEISGMVE